MNAKIESMKELPRYSPPSLFRIIDGKRYKFCSHFGFCFVYEREGKMVLVNPKNGKVELRLD